MLHPAQHVNSSLVLSFFYRALVSTFHGIVGQPNEQTKRQKERKSETRAKQPSVSVYKNDYFCVGVVVQSLRHVQLFATPMDCSVPGFPVLHHLLEPAPLRW